MTTTIKKRQLKEKELIIAQLKRTPIVQIACEKVGVGRATYYRWRGDDPEFAKFSDIALTEGASLVNDMAESQLLAAIRDGNLTGTIFWLKNHHPAYANRVEITAASKIKDEVLTPEQEVLLKKALALANLLPDQSEITQAVSMPSHDISKQKETKEEISETS